MTTIRGKAPVKATLTPEVTPLYCEQKVRIESGGYAEPGGRWSVQGDLSMECAARLVRSLRLAMRQVRDCRVEELNKAVTSAEGPVQ